MQYKYLSKGLVNDLIFLVFLVASIIPFLTVRYVPCLDAPQHLNTSNVIVNLLHSNALFQEYFSINDYPVGYWSGHFILSLFNAFLPDWLAEKILIVSYILFISLSFRYLIISIAGKPSPLMILIFPFAFTGLFLMGYYNYNIAYIFVFLIFGFWIRNHQRFTFKKGVLFALFFLLLYLSHAVVFALTGFCLALYVLFRFILAWYRSDHKKTVFREYVTRVLIILAAALPSVVLWFFYYLRVRSVAGDWPTEQYSFGELMGFLWDIRNMIGFHYDDEVRITHWLSGILLFLLLFLLVRFFVRGKGKGKREGSRGLKHIEWLFLFVTFLVFYVFFPDRLLTGNISNRIAILIFYMLIIWLSVQKYPSWMAYSAVLVIFVIAMSLRSSQHVYYKKLNDDVKEIKYLSDKIRDNAVLFPINFSSNWVHLHFLCYLGSDEPVVNLGNPQAWGQFPVVWDQDMPQIYVGDVPVNELRRRRWPTGRPDQEIKIADYVAIWRYDLFPATEEVENYRRILDAYYEKVAESPRGQAALYKFRLHDHIYGRVHEMRNRGERDPGLKIRAGSAAVTLEQFYIEEAFRSYNDENGRIKGN
ncbi:MAG: hypothetical protein R6T99_03730 [Bacteroidales bacterium]